MSFRKRKGGTLSIATIQVEGKKGKYWDPRGKRRTFSDDPRSAN